jgi:hypothetical protein
MGILGNSRGSAFFGEDLGVVAFFKEDFLEDFLEETFFESFFMALVFFYTLFSSLDYSFG